MRCSYPITTALAVLLVAYIPSPSFSFTASGDSSPRNSGNNKKNNYFRKGSSDGDDITPPNEQELSHILIKDTRSKRQHSLDDYRKDRYVNRRPKPSVTAASRNDTSSKYSNGFNKNNTTNNASELEDSGPVADQRRRRKLYENTSLSVKLSELSEWANRGQGGRAEEILISLEDEGIVPRMAYLATIRAWLSRDRVTQALNVLARMEASKFRVKAADYRPILKAFIKIGKPTEAIRLINHMAKRKTKNGSPILPEYDFEDPKRRKSIWSVLSCSVLPDARCLMIVANEFLKNEKLSNNKQKVACGLYEWAKQYKRADNYLFNAALSSFDDPRDMERFLLLHADTETEAICYMTVMQGYFKQSYCYNRGKKMESLLRRLHASQAGGAIQPDLTTYRQVLRAYFEDKDGKEAARFLKIAFDNVKSGMITDTDFSIELFVSWSKTVVDLLGKGDYGTTETTKLTLDVVNWIEDFMKWKEAPLGIDFYHFVMDNHIRAKSAMAIPFVEVVYNRLERNYRKSKKAELKPSAKTLNIVLKAYGTSRDADIMEKAEGLLLRMEEMYKNHNSTDEPCVVPDVVSYSTVIHGWASCRCPDSIQRADNVAKRLNAMHLSGNDAAKPDRGVDLAILNSFLWQSKEGNVKAGRRGPFMDDKKRVDSLIDCSPPDLVALTKIMNERRSSDAGERAEAIIDRLLVKYNETRDQAFLPDALMFSSAISAWGHTQLPNAARKAESILDKMMLLYDLTKSEKMKPNPLHFVAVIRAYAQPNQPEKAQNAKRVFDRMLTLHNEGFLTEAPRRDAFIAVLKACSHARGISYGKRQELDIAKVIYKMICNGRYCSHNEASYGAYIGAIRNCMERGPLRTSVFKASFERCCNEGFVDVFIIGQLRRSLTPQEFEKILGKDLSTKRIVEIDDLPSYWCRNVVNQQRRLRRPD